MRRSGPALGRHDIRRWSALKSGSLVHWLRLAGTWDNVRGRRALGRHRRVDWLRLGDRALAGRGIWDDE